MEATELAAALDEQLLYVREVGAIMSGGPQSLESRILLDIPFEANAAMIAARGLPAVAEICRAARATGIRRMQLIGLSVGGDPALSHARAQALRDALVSHCVSAAIWTGDCPGPGCPAIAVERASSHDALPASQPSEERTLIEIRVLG
jgi:hypothetical protein